MRGPRRRGRRQPHCRHLAHLIPPQITSIPDSFRSLALMSRWGMHRSSASWQLGAFFARNVAAALDTSSTCSRAPGRDCDPGNWRAKAGRGGGLARQTSQVVQPPAGRLPPGSDQSPPGGRAAGRIMFPSTVIPSTALVGRVYLSAAAGQHGQCPGPAGEAHAHQTPWRAGSRR